MSVCLSVCMSVCMYASTYVCCIVFLFSGTANQISNSKVLFFNAYGSYSIRLEYNGPDSSNYRQVVPSSVLRHGSLSNALIGSVLDLLMFSHVFPCFPIGSITKLAKIWGI